MKENTSSSMKINKDKITKRLSKLDIEKGSYATKFIKRRDGKINGELYVASFFFMILSGGTTLYNWTLQLCRLVDGLKLSEQGLERKLEFRQVNFAKWLLSKSLRTQLNTVVSSSKGNKPEELEKTALDLKHFNRVLLQDSTCINVPKNLADFFPSSFVKQGKSATARIQLTMDLLSDNYEQISLGSFRDNDGKASDSILEIIQPKDLILRDKGYWSLNVFKAIDEHEAYFLSRLKYGVNLYNEQNNEQNNDKLDLKKIFQKAKKNNLSYIDLSVSLGTKSRLKARLVAIRLPKEVADERRRKAKKDRHSKVNHTDDYYERLDWCIFVTNIPVMKLTAMQVAKVYRFRWRIEIIFKVWKSKFNFDGMFNKASMKPSRAIITFYLLLAWLTLFFTRLYNYFLIKVFNQVQRFISIFKFAEFLVVFMQDEKGIDKLMDNPDDFIDLVISFCLYDKRKRLNQMELIYC